ncbi:hypothetical protein BD289DRAFT_37238 [Coniella lustricola]|uniref:Peptidase S54 rhomboid domain-containing protein n=1 Tax=Coniella lustricola TaxID=2025994 RepID=A0A2T3AIW4_9PEZI|nr:hypothetical protein BD289DRAFT_37238 [Coniella lustricola]
MSTLLSFSAAGSGLRQQAQRTIQLSSSSSSSSSASACSTSIAAVRCLASSQWPTDCRSRKAAGPGSQRQITTTTSPRTPPSPPSPPSPQKWRSNQPSQPQTQRRTLFNSSSSSSTASKSRSNTVLTHYVHLPPTYKDQDGLPFRRNPADLDMKTVVRVFSGFKDMTPARATRLLRILHGRRVAGTLDDPSLRVNTAFFTAREIDAALAYLRDEVPVDEVLNAGLRAEDELRELELAAEEDDDEAGTSSTTSSSSVHGSEGSDEVNVTAANKKKTKKKENDPRSVYGESILDKIRATNRARREAEERAEAEERRKQDELAAQNWGTLATTNTAPADGTAMTPTATTPYNPELHRGLHPSQLQHYEAATSNLTAPPDIPRWRILLPMTAFAGAVLSALYLFVSLVAPPQADSTLLASSAAATTGHQDSATPPATTATGITTPHLVALAILATNLTLFIAWRRVRLWKYLNRHFILDFVTPRPHQLLTALATHQDPRHLLKAMFLAYTGALLLVPEVGPATFTATYLASGMCGYLATLWTRVLVRGELVYMFGASSAGFGVLCAYFWLYRFDGFKILGLPPDPYEGIQGLGIVGLLMAFFALVPMVRRQGGGVDWMSHFVGMLTGIGCAALAEGPWRASKKEALGVEEGKKDAEEDKAR